MTLKHEDGSTVTKAQGPGTDEQFTQRTATAVKAIETAKPPKVVADHLSPAVIKRGADGRLAGRKALTPKEEMLADLLATGVRPKLAAKLAGYSDPGGDGTRAGQRPAVVARMRALQRGTISRLSVVATRRLFDILSLKVTVQGSTMMDAIKYVHKVAGLDTSEEKANETKDVRTLTMAQLEALAAGYAAAKEQRTAPNRPGDDAQPVDIINESTT